MILFCFNRIGYVGFYLDRISQVGSSFSSDGFNPYRVLFYKDRALEIGSDIPVAIIVDHKNFVI